MSNEELERRMAFIIEQQAQFASNVKIDALVDSQIKLTKAQSQTDQTLLNLIAVVDRYFRDGRNGKMDSIT